MQPQKWIAENSQSLNFNTSKLSVVGDKLGGNMAIAVTMLYKERGGPTITFKFFLPLNRC